MATEDDVIVNEKGEIVENQVVEDSDDEVENEGSDPDESSNDEPESHAEGGEVENEDHTEDEREAIRERRRQERQNKKLKTRERESTLRNELAARDAAIAEMQEKLAAIERRNTGSEVAQIQTAKQQAAQAYSHFKEQVRLATIAANGDAMTDAIEKMQLAQRRFDDLDRIEKAYQRQQSAPAPLDPRLKNHADNWMQKNNWYDPSGSDEDSEIMLTIDKRMAKEGWNPTTPEYWEELTKRAQKRLPHRFQQRSKPKTVVSGSSRESAPSGSGHYTLSKAHVQALKDAGMWEDPAKRAAAIKNIKAYQKTNK